MASLIRASVAKSAATSREVVGSSPFYAQVAEIIARHATSLERALGVR